MNPTQTYLFYFLISIATSSALTEDPLILEIWPNSARQDPTDFESELIRMSPRQERRLAEATEPAPRPLQDAQRAVSLVRSKSKELGIRSDRIGVGLPHVLVG